MQNAITMPNPPISARLPDNLRLDAEIYAERSGLSLNGLLCVALRQFLDREFGVLMGVSASVAASAEVARPASAPRASKAALPSLSASDGPKPATEAGAPIASVRPPKSRADPCPCGAKDRFGYAVKYKHCHGKEVL